MKKSFLMILAAAALVSCSENEINPIENGDVQIALRSNTVDASGVATRAPFEGAISSTNKLEARVLASLAASFAGAPYTDGTMTFNGSGAVSYNSGAGGTATTYPDATSSVFLFGLYPSTDWTYTNGGTSAFTFTGKEDVMATSRVETVKNDVINSAYKTLSFKHLLTKLEVKMNASNAAINLFGDITSIKLVGDKTAGTTAIANQVTVVNNGNDASVPMVVTPVTGSATSLDFYGLSLDTDNKKVYSETIAPTYSLTTDSELMAYSMVAPVTASNAAGSEEYFLAINTANQGTKYIGVDLMAAGGTSAFNGSTSGRSFTISIYFKSNKEIMAQAEVADWIEEGEYQGEIAQ